jgi:NitT/TauT family transport system ATP-binding protein
MIEIRKCSKVFPRRNGQPEVEVLNEVDLTIKGGEFVCLIGPSGCGKTTLLKIIGGLVSWDRGEVLIDGLPMRGPGPDRSMVFQNLALLPWANVIDNVAFGLELRAIPKLERRGIAEELIERIGLLGFEDCFPRQLSGGMQQRVALARALAVNPKILLMDEPFGSLDAQTRRILQEDLLNLHLTTQKTIVFVTHNMSEAVRLGDRVALFSPRPGQIRQLIEVPFPRPRPPDLDKTAVFGELKEYLWSQLKGMQGSLKAPPYGRVSAC